MQRKTAVGTLVSVMVGVLAFLEFPVRVADIAATWGKLSFQAPVEALRLVLVAILGCMAAFLLAPALAGLVDGVGRRLRLAAEIQDRERDIKDLLSVILNRPEYATVIAELREGPAEVSERFARHLEAAGIIEPVAVTESSFYSGTFAVYRLSDLARPIVERLRSDDRSEP